MGIPPLQLLIDPVDNEVKLWRMIVQARQSLLALSTPIGSASGSGAVGQGGISGNGDDGPIVFYKNGFLAIDPDRFVYNEGIQLKLKNIDIKGTHGAGIRFGSAGAPIAGDNFDRPDSTNLGGIWTQIVNDAPFAIVSNKVRIRGADGGALSRGYAYASGTWNADQSSSAVLTSFNDGGTSLTQGWLAVRLDKTQPATTITGYIVVLSVGGGVPTLGVRRFNTGSSTTLFSGVVVAIGDLVELRAVGSTISLHVNGVQANSVIDASPITAGTPGFGTTFIIAAGKFLEFDFWSGSGTAETGGQLNKVINLGQIFVRTTGVGEGIGAEEKDIVDSDSFTRPNSTNLGPGWVIPSAGQIGIPFQVLNNRLRITRGAADSRGWIARVGNWTSDQSSSALFVSHTQPVPGSSALPTLAIRLDTTRPAATPTCYMLHVGGLAGDDPGKFTSCGINRVIAGANTALGVVFTMSLGATYKLEAVGDQIILRENGSIIQQVTDAAITSGSPGFMQLFTSPGVEYVSDWDNWSGETFVTGGTLPPPAFTETTADFIIQALGSKTGITLKTDRLDRFRVTPEGNIGAGTNTPATSALLDLVATDKALLITRLTTAQRDALTAVDGMVIYNSTLNEFQIRISGAWVTAPRNFGPAGYPVDVAATEDDGVAITVPRSDHRHAHGSGYLPDAHHAQVHTHGSHTGIGVDDHHAQLHKSAHVSGGGDAFASTDLLEAISKRLQESAGPTTLLMGAVADGQFLKRSGTGIVGEAVGGADHNILSATHLDSLAGTVVRGDLITGNSTPAWARLAIGSVAGLFPKRDSAGDLSYTADVAARTDATNNRLRYLNILCRAFLDANQSIADNTNVAINFAAESFDTHAVHDNVTNNSRLTVPIAGKYLVVGQVAWATNATGQRQIAVRKNGTDNISRFRFDTAASGETHMTISSFVSLAASDYVELAVLQNSGGALNALGGASGEDTALSVAYLGE